ncbi:hypothetical protein [Streptomyces sp. NPDC015130]|uniref:hypothetical protein n=1 Tax=Streptomyces sp. NPDC015130 TaxID=3364940 RepID=UPI0036FC692D
MLRRTTAALAASVTALQRREGGTAPDVAVVEYPHLPEFAAQGKVEDLSGTLGPLVRDRFPEATRQLVDLGGRTWAVPRDAAPLMLMYRKERAPRTTSTRGSSSWATSSATSSACC